MNGITSQKSYTPSFQAYYKSSFGKQLDKVFSTGEITDEFISDFSKIMPKKKNNISKMGAGGFGEVFRLDDYYVFKTYYSDKNLKVEPFKFVKDLGFGEFKTYCGKVLAKFGQIEIIRNATKNKKNFLEMASSLKQGAEKYSDSLKQFVALPQKAFDDVAKDFAALNNFKNGHVFYKFDFNNPNNFIKVGKSIKIVDDIAVTPCETPNDIQGFFRVFIQKGGDIDVKKEVFKKCILACEKHKLPMESAKKYLPQIMEEFFECSNTTFENYYRAMSELRKISDEKVRMNLVKNYIDENI